MGWEDYEGNQKSNRVCVYLSWVEEDSPRKLLAVLETPNRTGLAEANIVTEQLTNWKCEYVDYWYGL